MPDLRPATPADLPDIERIVEAAYAPYIPVMGQKPGPMLDDYAALVAEGRVQVAVEAGAVLGLLVLIPREGDMLLDNVAVAPEAQGRGLGRWLVARAEAAAVAAGRPMLRLYTHETMATNIALYQRLGFTETHRAKQAGFARVFMEKPVG